MLLRSLAKTMPLRNAIVLSS